MCKKEFKDILKHFSLHHDIRNSEQLNQEVDKAETKEQIKSKYSKFIMEINEKLKKGEISMAQWKQLRDNWSASE